MKHLILACATVLFAIPTFAAPGRGGGGGGHGGGGHGDPGRGGPGRGSDATICFYQDVNFGGNSFCVEAGDENNDLTRNGWNDTISSISIDGDAAVTVFKDIRFGGEALRFTSSVADIRSAGGFLWNDVISSFTSEDLGRRHGPPGRGGGGQACFYDRPNFQGQSFCLEAGDSTDDLRRNGWNDRVQSIWIDDVRVFAYEDIQFGGQRASLGQSDPNLAQHGWQNKISSIQVVDGGRR